MSIVSCPRCGDKVSLPPAASPSALVQCPLCCEEYYLSDALIQLPPMLIVVGGQAAAEQGSEYRLAESVAAAVSEPSEGGFGVVTPSRPQLRTVARPRRPEKSAVGEIVKVVLGGAAGLAGGLLVLWWVFGVDVAQLGPKVSKVDYLRFLVPQKLWDQSVRSNKDAAQLEPLAAGKQGAGNLKKKANGGPRQPDDAAPAAATAKSAGQNQVRKPSDPFLTLEDLGASVPASDGASAELKLDDPLSAVSPPKKTPTSSEVATPSADESNPEGKAKPPSEDAVDEKEARPVTPDSKQGDDEGAPAEKNTPGEKGATAPAGEKSPASGDSASGEPNLP